MEQTLSKRDKSVAWRERVAWPIHEKGFVRFLKWLGRLIFWPLYDIETVGLENIPAQGPCILAPNHISNFDPVIMALHTPPRHAFFMTKKELYKNFFMRWFLRMWGAFPVDRGQRDAWALQQAGRVLQAGQILCMFPEGTRSRGRISLQQGKLGTAKLALEHQVVVLPVAIVGTQDIQPGRKRPRLTVQVGPAIDLAALAGPPPYNYETFQEMTAVIMRRIAAMLPPEYRGVYAEPGETG
jgi:1-acyl-sn-glycerol-3-phosphate acyltransferase